jgi:hypothetical protein
LAFSGYFLGPESRLFLPFDRFTKLAYSSDWKARNHFSNQRLLLKGVFQPDFAPKTHFFQPDFASKQQSGTSSGAVMSQIGAAAHNYTPISIKIIHKTKNNELRPRF